MHQIAPPSTFDRQKRVSIANDGDRINNNNNSHDAIINRIYWYLLSLFIIKYALGRRTSWKPLDFSCFHSKNKSHHFGRWFFFFHVGRNYIISLRCWPQMPAQTQSNASPFVVLIVAGVCERRRRRHAVRSPSAPSSISYFYLFAGVFPYVHKKPFNGFIHSILGMTLGAPSAYKCLY